MIAKYISCVGGIYDPVHFQSELELEKRKKDKTTAYFIIGLAASFAVGVGLIALPFIQRLSLMNEIDTYEKKIGALRSIEIVVDDYYVSKDKVTDVNNFLAITTNPNDKLLEMIKSLEKGMPSNISIKALSVDNGNVTMSASTSTKQTVAKFITQLQSMPGVTNVFVSSCTESADAFGVITTSFSASFSFNSDIATYLEDVTVPSDDETVEEEVQ
jgi:type IV pilus assembly protein PilM